MHNNKHEENAPLRSAPDFESMPNKYNEPPVRRKEDQMPSGNVSLSLESVKAGRSQESKAVLRLQIEKLLQRREAAPVEAWQALGEEATTLLVQMLDDRTVREALRQRVIATLGQLGAVSAISQLGDILLNSSESALNRTYAAIALGNITDPRVVPLLGGAVTDQNPMVRRQVVRALGRANQVDAIPYLLILREDTEHEIANLAAMELRACEKQFGAKFERAASEEENIYKAPTQTKLHPAREDD